MKLHKQKAIGGYLELLAGSTNFSTLWKNDNMYGFNSGRNAFEAYLINAGVTKVYLPSYICPVVLEPLKRHSIPYEFYSINRQLESDFFLDPPQQTGKLILFVNYFGIKDRFATGITERFKNVIVDNSQAFYSSYPGAVATFNSCPKFFGVPDGGFLNGNKIKEKIELMGLAEDTSGGKLKHLVISLEKEPEDGYPSFLELEESLINLPLKRMSAVTRSLLSQIPFEQFRKQRVSNFIYLQDALGDKNELLIETEGIVGPLVFPFLYPDGKRIKSKLIEERIFIPTYWPDIEEKLPFTETEKYLCDNLIPLPIDQRYGLKEMKRVIERVLAFI